MILDNSKLNFPVVVELMKVLQLKLIMLTYIPWNELLLKS